MHKLYQLLEPLEIRIEIRASKPFKQFLQPWNAGGYNRRAKVGPIMGSIKDMMSLDSDSDQDDWEKYYVENIRNEDQILGLTTELSVKQHLELAVAINWWWIHILDCSWSGFEDERFCIELIRIYAESKGLEVRYSTSQEDADLGVDAVVFDPRTGKIIVGIQIKPVSYFHGRSADNVQAREVYNKAKYRKFTEQTGAPVWYMDATNSRKQGEIVWWRAVY